MVCSAAHAFLVAVPSFLLPLRTLVGVFPTFREVLYKMFELDFREKSLIRIRKGMTSGPKGCDALRKEEE